MRWAETMRVSKATPSASSVSAAWRMVSQSDWLPMMIPTAAASVMVLSLFGSRWRARRAIIAPAGSGGQGARRLHSIGAACYTAAAQQ